MLKVYLFLQAKVAAAAIAEDQSVRSKKQVVIAKKPKVS